MLETPSLLVNFFYNFNLFNDLLINRYQQIIQAPTPFRQKQAETKIFYRQLLQLLLFQI